MSGEEAGAQWGERESDSGFKEAQQGSVMPWRSLMADDQAPNGARTSAFLNTITHTLGLLLFVTGCHCQ